MDLEETLAQLQLRFATIDLFEGPSDPNIIRFLVIQLKDIQVRMDACKNHQRPHVHIAYGTEHHAASYAIDSGGRLAGELSKNYDRKVREWIGENKKELSEVWRLAQAGQDPKPIIYKLRGQSY